MIKSSQWSRALAPASSSQPHRREKVDGEQEPAQVPRPSRSNGARSQQEPAGRGGAVCLQRRTTSR